MEARHAWSVSAAPIFALSSTSTSAWTFVLACGASRAARTAQRTAAVAGWQARGAGAPVVAARAAAASAVALSRDSQVPVEARMDPSPRCTHVRAHRQEGVSARRKTTHARTRTAACARIRRRQTHAPKRACTDLLAAQLLQKRGGRSDQRFIHLDGRTPLGVTRVRRMLSDLYRQAALQVATDRRVTAASPPLESMGLGLGTTVVPRPLPRRRPRAGVRATYARAYVRACARTSELCAGVPWRVRPRPSPSVAARQTPSRREPARHNSRARHAALHECAWHVPLRCRTPVSASERVTPQACASACACASAGPLESSA